MILELCISDENKPLLLANPAFIPYLVDALLLDADHPRAGMKTELKSWCQTHHAECLAQLAVFEPAREPLRQDPSVIPSLEAVAEAGLSAEARQFAQAALLALSDKELHHEKEGQMHVMLSCESTHTVHVLLAPCNLLTSGFACPDQWDHQQTIERLNESLIGRGFLTWFDLTNMKGSTMDAMR